MGVRLIGSDDARDVELAKSGDSALFHLVGYIEAPLEADYSLLPELRAALRVVGQSHVLHELAARLDYCVTSFVSFPAGVRLFEIGLFRKRLKTMLDV